MVNKAMYELGAAPSAIRALFAYGLERKTEIGADKVFDFSIGNPSVPAPEEVKQAILDAMELPSAAVHGYTPAAGIPSLRAALAESINGRFGMAASAENVYVIEGAAASITVSLAAICNPGDEVIVISPYFPEYKVWIEAAGCKCVEVPALENSFQLDLAALEFAVSAKTKAIILNSPNNPTGAVYPQADLKALANMLYAKQHAFASEIYLISDEPYREIAYEGVEVPYVPSLYNNTLVCYSYSKSFSLPGERIGYVYVSERTDNGTEIFATIAGAARAFGHICAPALFQHALERCLDAPVNIKPYEENRELLATGLAELGYEYVQPQGAFYLWVKALEPDAEAFAERAKQHELLLVPSTSFGCDGWVRIGYCTDQETIKRSLPAFKALKEAYQE